MPPMSPDEYRNALSALGLSQAGAARLFGLSTRACEFYAAGSRRVPPPVAKLLRLLVAGKVTALQVELT